MSEDKRNGVSYYVVTRKDLIKSGGLVEIPTALCQETGFATSVAVTATIQEEIESTEGGRRGIFDGHYLDFLHMAGVYVGAKLNQLHARHEFPVILGGREQRFIAVSSLDGEQGEPAVTFMRPEED